MNRLLQLKDGRQLVESSLSETEYGNIRNIVVNDKTGEMYMLQNKNNILYWDGNTYTNFRVPQHESEKAYSLKDIDIDTRSGLAYVTSEDGWNSHVFVLQGDQVVAELPLNGNYNRSVAVDEKHDYVYVTNYRSGGLTVLRGTEVITTLASGGIGSWEVLVDERTDLIYVTNADSGSVAIFGFGDPPDRQVRLGERVWAWVTRE